MDYFSYRSGVLHAEDASVSEIAAKVGTPVYIYSVRTFIEHFRKARGAFAELDALICYSVKANGNLAILRRLAAEGAGFDVVSGGELYRVLRAGGEAKKVTFAGVAKTDREIAEALDAGVGLFDVESEQELENIARIAAAKRVAANVALRVNPDVDPRTHRYITTGKAENKFGVDIEKAGMLFRRHHKDAPINLAAVHMHIGSQITDVTPYAEALGRVAKLIANLRAENIEIGSLNIGGGFGIFYRGDEAKDIRAFADVIIPVVKELGVRLVLEPGRFIIGNAGILVCEVQYVKTSGPKTFVMLDAGMNALIRPALYGAYHKIWPVRAKFQNPDEGAVSEVDIVGPICESADVFAAGREIPEVKRGDLIAVFSAGAYGFAMSSQYNSQPRPAEVLVEGDKFTIIRRRETYEDLIRGEEDVQQTDSAPIQTLQKRVRKRKTESEEV